MTTEATPAVKCAACQQIIPTFSAWFTEDCPARTTEPPEHGGHQITWAERTTLPFESEALNQRRRT